jgi:hypothetical protein
MLWSYRSLQTAFQRLPPSSKTIQLFRLASSPLSHNVYQSCMAARYEEGILLSTVTYVVEMVG